MNKPPGHWDGQVEPLERETLMLALRTRESLLTGILGSLESFVTVDRDWRLTFANAAAMKMARMSEDELLGQDLRDLAVTRFPKLALAPLEQAMRGKTITKLEVATGGRESVFACTAYPLSGGGLAIYARDVTERERERDARRASDELYRELVESVNSAVLRWDRNHVLTFVNKYAVELFGWRPEEIIGGPVSVFVPQRRAGEPDVSNLDEEVLANPERSVASVKENVTKDGRRLWLAWTNRALRDEEGEVTEILAIGNDVTEMVQAQAALRESEERYRTIVELADEDLEISSDVVYSFGGSIRDDVERPRRHLREWFSAAAAGARRHKPWVLLAAIAFELAFLIPMGLSPDSRLVLGMPGSLLALTVVVAAVLAGWQIGLAAALAGGIIFWATVADFGGRSAPATTVVSTGIWVAAALLAGLLTDALREQMRLRKSAAVALARAETMREQEADQAAQEERRRIASDLHDFVTQSLFAATLRAEALAVATGDEPFGSSTAAEDVLRLNRGALAQMRTLLMELRGDPIEEVPLHQLLRNVTEAAESRAGVKVTLGVDEGSALPPGVHEAAYRITQEALNNVVRHAKAQSAWVQLRVEDGGVRLVIGDDGQGFDAAAARQGHFGLASMRERAGETGGELQLTSSVDEGTVVTVVWRTE